MTTIKTDLGQSEQADRIRVQPTGTLAETDVQRALESLRAEIDAILATLPNSSVDNTIARFDGTNGAIQGSGVTIDDSDFIGNADGVGIGGATADATNRLSVNTPAVLFNRETDTIQVKLNKAATGNTASFLFQTGFSGRAEIGTIASDSFQFKTSPDGSAFTTGISIAVTNAAVTIPVNLSPAANDGAALGTTALGWADLFLASGAVVNFNNGDVLITHSTNTLAFTGASSGYTHDAAVLPSANDAAALGASGTAWADLFLASGAVINLAAGDVTITHASNALTFDGASTYTLHTTGGATSLAITGQGSSNIELGRIDNVSSSSFIDFHSGATTVDYDSRLIATGGTGVLGGGNLRVDANNFSPTANDGCALGTSTVSWSDLSLASGGLIGWNNGDVIITHSANALAFTGASSGYTFDAALSIGTGNALTAGTIEVGNASDTTLSRTAAATLAIEGAVIRTAGKETIWVPATAMKQRAVGPATGSFSAGSTEFDYLAFDPGTAEDATFVIAMPKSWDEGSVSYQAYWLHPATATNFAVVWSGFVKAYSNDDAIDGASYTTIGSVTDTGGTTSDLYIADESASTAVGSAAENDLLSFIIRRDAANGSDTLAVDAYLIGVKIFYTTNAKNDA